ncbi:MAG TPA: hypothetical protein VEU62_00310 [Bryobacterales bacterium]|nr:hypothetical protein [Bryobacterales bacterium]
MPRYRIHYLKESQRQHFRQAPPGAVPLQLKRNHYEPGGEIEAASPYAAWKQMLEADASPAPERRPIGVGDALENETGALQVCKYVGFEEAQWFVPEPAAVPAESASPPAVTPDAEHSPRR